MNVKLYNFQTGQAVSEIELPDAIFNRAWNPDLVHQVFLAHEANRRVVIAHAKGRGEVRGGGRKPWRQKGTGRARHGSIRSPIWKGGGVTHGPTKEKDYGQKINKKMKRAALLSLLSKKTAEAQLKVVDSLSLDVAKTKLLAAALIKVLDKNKKDRNKMSALLVSGAGAKNIFRAAANIPKVKVLESRNLNVADLLKYQNIIFDQKAVVELSQRQTAAK